MFIICNTVNQQNQIEDKINAIETKISKSNPFLLFSADSSFNYLYVGNMFSQENIQSILALIDYESILYKQFSDFACSRVYYEEQKQKKSKTEESINIEEVKEKNNQASMLFSVSYYDLFLNKIKEKLKNKEYFVYFILPYKNKEDAEKDTIKLKATKEDDLPELLDKIWQANDFIKMGNFRCDSLEERKTFGFSPHTIDIYTEIKNMLKKNENIKMINHLGRYCVLVGMAKGQVDVNKQNYKDILDLYKNYGIDAMINGQIIGDNIEKSIEELSNLFLEYYEQTGRIFVEES